VLAVQPLFRNRFAVVFFILASQNNVNDAPPPPERGSSYAVMSQQSALRSNGSTTSNLPPTSQQPASMKRVSFHDSNANSESMLRNVSSGTSNPPSISMDTIREDPNVSNLLIIYISFIPYYLSVILFYPTLYFDIIDLDLKSCESAFRVFFVILF